MDSHYSSLSTISSPLTNFTTATDETALTRQVGKAANGETITDKRMDEKSSGFSAFTKLAQLAKSVFSSINQTVTSEAKHLVKILQSTKDDILVLFFRLHQKIEQVGKKKEESEKGLNIVREILQFSSKSQQAFIIQGHYNSISVNPQFAKDMGRLAISLNKIPLVIDEKNANSKVEGYKDINREIGPKAMSNLERIMNQDTIHNTFEVAKEKYQTEHDIISGLLPTDNLRHECDLDTSKEGEVKLTFYVNFKLESIEAKMQGINNPRFVVVKREVRIPLAELEKNWEEEVDLSKVAPHLQVFDSISLPFANRERAKKTLG